MLAAIILGLIGAAALSFSGSELRALPGQARALDGDSLRIGNDELRLWGIDAPEFKQECKGAQGKYLCGREAQKQLRVLIENSVLSCKGLGRDKYDRLLAVCRKGNIDINAELVRNGFAYAYGGYQSEENQAKRAKRGVWAGNNERPKAYRERMQADLDLAPGMLDALYHWLQRLIV